MLKKKLIPKQLYKMWQNLPPEIINLVLSFTLCPQPVQLLQDIQSYYQFEQLTSKHYYDLWIIHMESMVMEDRNLLANDLWRFNP